MTKRDMAALVAAKLQKAERMIEKSVWEANLATYEEHARLSHELAEMGLPPHHILFIKATRYLQKTSIEQQEHAAVIKTFGEVVAFAGSLLAAYTPVDRSSSECDGQKRAH